MFCACCAPTEDAQTVQNLPAPATDEKDYSTVSSEPVLASRDSKPEDVVRLESARMDGVPSVSGAAKLPMEGKAEFELQVDRPNLSTPLGVVLDPSGSKVLHVCEVLDGSSPITEANEKVSEEQRLRKGDFIVEVNGIRGDLTAMLNTVQAKTSLLLKVRRPELFEISCDTKGQPLGCSITYDSNTGISLVIERINGGPILDWNKAHPDDAVRDGDRIITVNGTSGSSVTIMSTIRASHELTLRFARVTVP